MDDRTPRSKEKMGPEGERGRLRWAVGRVSILSGWSVAGLQRGWWRWSWVWLCVNRSEHAGSPLLSPHSPLSLSLLPHPLSHCSSFSFPSSLPSSFFVIHTFALSLWYFPLARLQVAEIRLGRGHTLGGGQPRESACQPSKEWGSCLEAGSSSFSDMRDPRSCEDPRESLKVELALSWPLTHTSAMSGQTMALSSLLSMCPELCLCPLPHIIY